MAGPIRRTAAERALLPVALVALLAAGAIFGFFYAWVCSTMWGLDDTDPQVAIAAMQAMNSSVRNAAFAPVFFGTPLVLAATALLGWRTGYRRVAQFFTAAAAVSLLGGLMVTLLVSVPMNEGLADHTLPMTTVRAQHIWSDYSGPWQMWNGVRTATSGLALLLAGYGVTGVHRRTAVPPPR